MKAPPLRDYQLELSLPFFSDQVRAMPRAVLYSALFAPVKRGERENFKREKMGAVGAYDISFTGQQLDQSDLDIFQWLIFSARGRDGVSTKLQFKIADALRETGRADGSKSRICFLDSLIRLQACAVEIKFKQVTYSGSFIDSVTRNDTTGLYEVTFNPRLAALFGAEFGGYAQVHYLQRESLKGKELAKWLHAFVTGYTRPLTFTLEDLAKLARTKQKRLRDFRAALDKAADDIRLVGCEIHLAWNKAGDSVVISVLSKKSEERIS